ncbi:uncharacterized protein [Montipora capricornis]|uniref:uncharacterized protein isoform X3 n=2 Tax=Montipora capricornis TaxID=246305 RepID=UPI0035F16590
MQKRLVSYVSIATILILSRTIHSHIDPSFDRREGGKTFLEHANYVLNVAPSTLVTTTDSLACALECLHRSSTCLSFNFAIYPESGNCKLLSMDKYTVPEKFEPSSSYYHFSILSVCEFKPCRNGAKCHPLYESNGFLCTALNWIRLNKDEVCFGARDESYGNFTIPSDGSLFGLKLVYRSGYITYNKNKKPFGSQWGCKGSGLCTLVTNAANKVIFPQDYENDSYFLINTHLNSSELLFYSLPSPLKVRAKDEFRIWYNEDLRNAWEDDNSGRTCVEVFGLFQDMEERQGLIFPAQGVL